MTASAFGGLAGMAFRNLGRHRVKTIITTTAVAVSVALYIFMDAWILGMNLDSRRNIVSYEIGAAKIQTEEYFSKKDELPMHESFSGWEALSADLAAAGYASAPRFVFSGTLHSRAGTAPLVFNAVDPGLEARLLRYPAFLESGRFPRPGAFELALGSIAAEKLRVGIPRRPTRGELENELVAAAGTEEERAFVRSLYGPPPAGKKQLFTHQEEATRALEAEKLALREDAAAAELDRLWDLLSASGRMDVRISTVIDLKDPERPDKVRHVNQLVDAVVVGVVNSPNPKTNGNVGFMPLDALQDETGLMLGGRVTELLIRRADAKDGALPGKDESDGAIRAALGPRLPEGLTVRGWKDYAADYLVASNGDNVSTRVMIVLLFLLSFIGIANTMLMAILERTKETGMLRALGMTDGQLLLAYVLEAAMVGAIGSAAGTALGCLINIPMVEHGIDYSAMSRAMEGDFGYRIVALFRSAWNYRTIALSGVVATVLSGTAAILPTLRALRMPVTESLRFE